MSDKPQAAFDAPFALPDLAVVTLSGRDAVAFAQAQFMSDVAALAPGHWHWSGWLTPKGRVIALFAVLRRDAESLYVLLHDADPAAFVSSLQRFVFRSKVMIGIDRDAHVSGALRIPSVARGHEAHIDGDAIELDLGTDAHPRTLQVGPTAAPSDPDAHARWRALDMAFGLPRLPADQADSWTPQQLSLDRLRAFSVRKGCYPGQEIVARTHFLGQVRRGLVALRAPDAAPRVGDVQQDGNTIGRLVCAAQDLRLAVLPLERAETPLTVDGLPLEPVALLGGLAR
ncbi:folate-binding protein YgfZ [Lysobacteraceae bacterium NML93-0792]|nr:folate-binding protein YgfZ [Xanthomonadaceae bacterium NML93-0792]PBS14619.1 folate-binding protein YgfZ [Xanthomonadaceae bacterium NML93-0793]PBS18983.1 folate-binding protein YgfZ [Xanthomonadaceae bacterium NML93-0831]